MTKDQFKIQLKKLQQSHERLIKRRNRAQNEGNGIFDRYELPVLTAAHTPLAWRYDLNYSTNPHLLTRLGINCVFNVGAMEWGEKIILMARVEGWDRKSFFAVAESKNGVDGFRFWDYPVRMPELDSQETNLYDMRLVQHEDGWIYGLFCAERHDDSKKNDLSAAIARGGIARTKDLVKWERLPDLKTPALHQRNCVLHPEFINGKYAFYTRPMADFAATGSGDGIGWGLCADITRAVIEKETIVDSPFLPFHQRGKKRAGSCPHQNGARLVALGAWCAHHGGRNALCALRFSVRFKRSFESYPCTRWLLHGSGRRGTRGGCFQCGIRQRLGWRVKTARSLFIMDRRTHEPMLPPPPWKSCWIIAKTHRRMPGVPGFPWNSGVI